MPRTTTFDFSRNNHPSGKHFIVEMRKRSYEDDGSGKDMRGEVHHAYADADHEDAMRTRVTEGELCNLVSRILDVLSPNVAKGILLKRFGDGIRAEGIELGYREGIRFDGKRLVIVNEAELLKAAQSADPA